MKMRTKTNATQQQIRRLGYLLAEFSIRTCEMPPSMTRLHALRTREREQTTITRVCLTEHDKGLICVGLFLFHHDSFDSRARIVYLALPSVSVHSMQCAEPFLHLPIRISISRGDRSTIRVRT